MVEVVSIILTTYYLINNRFAIQTKIDEAIFNLSLSVFSSILSFFYSFAKYTY